MALKNESTDLKCTENTDNARKWLSEVFVSSKPFVIYRLPFERMARGLCITQSASLDLTQIDLARMGDAFVVSPFDRSQQNGWVFRGDQPAKMLHLSGEVDAQSTGKAPVSFPEEATCRAAYHRVFTRMMDALNQKRVDKVVLARKKRVDAVSTEQLPFLFEYLCHAHPGAFVYLIDHPETGRWMGASPESLLKKDGPVVETVALAATLKNTDALETWGHKELEEQGMVSVFVDEVLRKFGVKEFEKRGPETVGAGEMVHLKTTYRIPIPSLTMGIGPLMMALHPTPALCGFPKEPSFTLIKEQEGFSRQLYGGFLGPVGAKEFQFFVNIRCMKITGDKTLLYLGGGLTRESVEEQEWEETRLKARTLLTALYAVKKSYLNESTHLQ